MIWDIGWERHQHEKDEKRCHFHTIKSTPISPSDAFKSFRYEIYLYVVLIHPIRLLAFLKYSCLSLKPGCFGYMNIKRFSLPYNSLNERGWKLCKLKSCWSTNQWTDRDSKRKQKERKQTGRGIITKSCEYGLKHAWDRYDQHC